MPRPRPPPSHRRFGSQPGPGDVRMMSRRDFIRKNPSRREQRMNWKTSVILLSGLLVACAQTPSPEATAPPEQAQALATAPAQPPPSAQPPVPAPAPAAGTAPVDHIVNIRGASCEDLLRLSPEDREAASMFYIGY